MRDLPGLSQKPKRRRARHGALTWGVPMLQKTSTGKKATMFNWLVPHRHRHHYITEIIMSDITDKLDAAVNAALAKIAAAGDVAAKDAQITQLTADKAALQAELDAANADMSKNTDALNAA